MFAFTINLAIRLSDYEQRMIKTIMLIIIIALDIEKYWKDISEKYSQPVQ